MGASRRRRRARAPSAWEPASAQSARQPTTITVGGNRGRFVPWRDLDDDDGNEVAYGSFVQPALALPRARWADLSVDDSADDEFLYEEEWFPSTDVVLSCLGNAGVEGASASACCPGCDDASLGHAPVDDAPVDALDDECEAEVAAVCARGCGGEHVLVEHPWQ